MYARLETIKGNIQRSKNLITDLKIKKQNAKSKSRIDFVRGQIDDERRVLSRLETAYQASRKAIKSRRV